MGDVIDLRQRILDRNKEHNNGVLERLRAGDSLSLVPPQATWFPPRGTFSRELGRMVVSAPIAPADRTVEAKNDD